MASNENNNEANLASNENNDKANLASNESNDKTEQLRFLALKFMVRRSKQNSSNSDAGDQDIKLFRAVALNS